MSTTNPPSAGDWLGRLLERWAGRATESVEGPIAGPEPVAARVEAPADAPRAVATLDVDPGADAFGFYRLEAGAETDEALALAELALSLDADPEPELAMRAVAGRSSEEGGVRVAALSLSMSGADAAISLDGSADGFRIALSLGGGDDAPLG